MVTQVKEYKRKEVVKPSSSKKKEVKPSVSGSGSGSARGGSRGGHGSGRGSGRGQPSKKRKTRSDDVVPKEETSEDDSDSDEDLKKEVAMDKMRKELAEMKKELAETKAKVCKYQPTRLMKPSIPPSSLYPLGDARAEAAEAVAERGDQAPPPRPCNRLDAVRAGSGRRAQDPCRHASPIQGGAACTLATTLEILLFAPSVHSYT